MRARSSLAAALRRQPATCHAKAQPLRGKWAAPIPHNASFRKAGPVAALALRLVVRPRAAPGPAGSRNAPYVWRPCVAAKPVRALRAWCQTGATRVHHTGCCQSVLQGALVRLAGAPRLPPRFAVSRSSATQPQLQNQPRVYKRCKARTRLAPHV